MGRAQTPRAPGNFTKVFGKRRGANRPESGSTDVGPALIVSGSSTKCSVCGKGADYKEKTHRTVLGYGSDLGEGCGVLWTHITTGYIGGGIEDATRALRPDLIFVGYDAGVEQATGHK
jgi:hypothetical protein